MRFTCVRCQAKYRISDERIEGRDLRVRCRHCGVILRVRDPKLQKESLPGTRERQVADPVPVEQLVTRVATPASAATLSLSQQIT